MSKQRGNAAEAGKRLKRQRAENSPAGEQIKALFSKSCIIRWSDGHESTAIIGDIFYTEDAYIRYRGYKQSGKAYPVEVTIAPLQDPTTILFPEDPEGERELCATISKHFTQALKQFVEDAGEPITLADGAAEEINRQAEDGQRELQRLADEADEAIRGTL